MAMSGSGWVSGPGIRAFGHALGAFAVAAGVSAAIHWYLSRDSQKEAAEDNEAGLQRNQDLIQDGQSPRDSPKEPDEVPGENFEEPQVSDDVGIKSSVLLYVCQLPGLSDSSVKGLHTAERYNPRSDTWTLMTALPKDSFPVAHEAAVCGGKIYITGGNSYYRLFYYKPTSDRWKESPYEACWGHSCDMVAIGRNLNRFNLGKDCVSIIR